MRLTIFAGMIGGMLMLGGCVPQTPAPARNPAPVNLELIEAMADGILDFVEGRTLALPEIAEEAAAAVTALTEGMRARHSGVRGFEREGTLGEDNRGYVKLRGDAAQLAPEARNRIQKLLAGENRDRKALYREMTRVQPDSRMTISMIEQVWVLRRFLRGKTGEVFQLPPQGTVFERLKTSKAGKRLGNECVPGAWVAVP